MVDDLYVLFRMNDIGTYCVVELDGTQMVVPTGKRITIFKKQHDANPKIDDHGNDANKEERTKDNKTKD